MTKLTSLLVATDFSVDGNNAVRRAAMLAHEHGARLHILHVLETARRRPLRDGLMPLTDPELQTAEARDALRRLAIDIARSCDVAPSVEVVVGDPFETLMQRSEHADLVVLGRPRQGRLGAWLAGHTVDRMLRRSRRPVLVVRSAVERPYRRVLVPTDFSASADAALRVAARMHRDGELHVFHAIQSRREAVLREAYVPERVIRQSRHLEEAAVRARLCRTVANLGLDGTTMRFALAHGPAARATLLHAEELGADLVVAGRRGQSVVGRFLLDRVIDRLLSGSPSDLLMVPKPKGDAAHRVASPLPPRPASPAPTGMAAVARGGSSHARAPTTTHWIYNTARFLPRPSS